MRNLKRALSLALTAVMVLGMMVIGAGAVSYDDFSDKDKIVNTEAVSTLVELGVIAGKDDGSYDPSGIVTRAEMAKMICVVLNGGKDPQLGTVSTYTYSDTVTSWASAYIEYCTTLGIVAGDGTGKFNPTATVTGAQAAKMLLVASGYQAAIQGYTGNNWANAVNVDANGVGLYDDLSINPSAGLTRDDAAQMVYNALDAKMVTYDYTLVSDGKGGFTSIPTLKDDSDAKTVLESKFDAVKVEGVVVANEISNLMTSGSTLESGKTRIAITNSDDQDAYAGTQTFSVSTGLDQLGRAVTLYVKKNTNSSKATVYGNLILSSDNKVVVDNTKDSIKTVADDNDLKVLSDTQVASNYGSTVDYSDYTDPTTAGVEKILIDNNDDGDLDYVLMNTYYFGKVTSYVTSDNGSISINAGTSNVFTASDKDDVVGFDDVAKNDYVMVASIGGKLDVSKAETVTGNLDGYKGSTTVTKLTVDGTDYNVVNFTKCYTGGDDDIKNANAYQNLDGTATFYLNKNGYIVAVGNATETANDYALVLGKGTDGLTNRIKVMLPDGSNATYELNTSGTGALAYTGINVGEVYGYSINSSDKIKLTAANELSSLTNAGFDKNKTVITTGTTPSVVGYATTSTVFYYIKTASIGASISSSDVSVYVGYANAPTLDSGVSGAVYTSGATSSRPTAVVFYASSLTTADLDDNLYIYSVGTTTTDYTNAKAFIAGSDSSVSIKVDGSGVAVGAYTYTINSDGYYELKTDKFDSSNSYTSGTTTYGVYGSNSSTFVVGSGTDYGTYAKELKITSDTLLVDDSDYLDNTTAALGEGPSEGDKLAFVLYNDDSEALLVVVANPKATDTTTTTSTLKDGSMANGASALTITANLKSAATAATTVNVTVQKLVEAQGTYVDVGTTTITVGATTSTGSVSYTSGITSGSIYRAVLTLGSDTYTTNTVAH